MHEENVTPPNERVAGSPPRRAWDIPARQKRWWGEVSASPWTTQPFHGERERLRSVRIPRTRALLDRRFELLWSEALLSVEELLDEFTWIDRLAQERRSLAEMEEWQSACRCTGWYAEAFARPDTTYGFEPLFNPYETRAGCCNNDQSAYLERLLNFLELAKDPWAFFGLPLQRGRELCGLGTHEWQFLPHAELYRDGPFSFRSFEAMLEDLLEIQLWYQQGLALLPTA